MKFLSLLPPVVWALTFAVLKRKMTDREAFLTASIIWGTLVVVSTEALSPAALLNRASLSFFWGAAAAGLLFYAGRTGGNIRFSFQIESPARLTVFSVGAVLFCLAVTAFWAAPNTADSMTYHLSRVMHWTQNQSVDYYPTHILRQLFMKPWAEYAILHFQILSGGDSWANFVQWFSLAGCAVGVSLAASLLGADGRAQAFAALFVVTLPMAILQASSTQNDLVVSFWIIAFVVETLLFRKNGRAGHAFLAAACLGLAALTKPTAYLCLFFFGFWLVFFAWEKKGWKSLRILGAGALIFVLINAADYRRDNDANTVLTPQSFTSNVVRNLAIHWGTPWRALNQSLEGGVGRLHEWLGIGASDPRTTMVPTKFHVEELSLNEDLAGNPLHFAMIAVFFVLFFIQKTPRLFSWYVGDGGFFSFLRGIDVAAVSQPPAFAGFCSFGAGPGDDFRRQQPTLDDGDFRLPPVRGLFLLDRLEPVPSARGRAVYFSVFAH